MQSPPSMEPLELSAATRRCFELAADKARQLDRSWDPARGTPVFTVDGTYTTRGWTEWTQGFQYGMMILAGDALDDHELIDLGRTRTVQRMLPHVTHTGVHDHGFNNLSTYGNLLRLHVEKRLPENPWEVTTYRNAIAVSGAVQAARWSGVPVREPSPRSAESTSLGYICSFNGPHSLFIDTMRTLRIMSAALVLQHGTIKILNFPEGPMNDTAIMSMGGIAGLIEQLRSKNAANEASGSAAS